MALRKALHCAVDGEDDEGSKHHFPLGLHNENNREHAASGVNSSSLFIRWSAQLRQPFLCAPSSDNGTRLPHHSPNQTERGGHRSISYLSAYGWGTRHPADYRSARWRSFTNGESSSNVRAGWVSSPILPLGRLSGGPPGEW